MTPDLPTGTVTFLFTDIDGNAPLWERKPQTMRPALAQHDAVLRLAVAAHGGQIYKFVGGVVQAGFARLAKGVAAAQGGQVVLFTLVAEWLPGVDSGLDCQRRR